MPLCLGIDPRKVQDSLSMSLPVVPDDISSLVASAYSFELFKEPQEKLIPRNMWIAFRKIPPIDNLQPHLVRMTSSARKSGWMIHLFNKTSQEEFMRKYYHDTSLLWVYEIIHPHYDLSTVDIWKYAALYAFGGFYIDDDAVIKTELEQIIHSNDTVILTREGRKYSECYVDNHPLSIKWQQILWNIRDPIDIFENYGLANFAMFWEPRNPLLLRVLKNIVQIAKKEYAKKTVILPNRRHTRRISCFTGSMVLGATIRSVLLPQNKFHSTNYTVRVMTFDFEEYNGVSRIPNFKPWGGHDPKVNRVGTMLSRYLY